MHLHHLEQILFSPTGTTRTVAGAMASGLAAPKNAIMDLTLPGPEPNAPQVCPADVALLAAPVYAGRIPTLAAQRLRRRVRGQGQPCVLVVVYGNRAFDDALLELSDLATELDFVPVAAAAFIGEHSFSTAQTPIAPGRPDAQDQRDAAAFGQKIRNKLQGLAHPRDLESLPIPGNRPYRAGVPAATIAPETDTAQCILCGECARVCPSGAVVVNEQVRTDSCRCLRCFACVRACPADARHMQHPAILELSQKLHREFSRRQSPLRIL